MVDTDIIDLVQEQNQNSIFQPQVSAVSQTQLASIPQTSANAQAQGAGSALFGDTTNTGSLLNQTEVLGTTSSNPSSTADNTQFQPKSGGVSVPMLLIALVLLVVLAYLFRKIDLSKQEQEEEDS